MRAVRKGLFRGQPGRGEGADSNLGAGSRQRGDGWLFGGISRGQRGAVWRWRRNRDLAQRQRRKEHLGHDAVVRTNAWEADGGLRLKKTRLGGRETGA